MAAIGNRYKLISKYQISFILYSITSFCVLFKVCAEGLRVLNRAHSVQKHPLPFPLADLKRMLKFESEQEVGRMSHMIISGIT